jgi:hypothetical protein
LSGGAHGRYVSLIMANACATAARWLIREHRVALCLPVVPAASPGVAWEPEASSVALRLMTHHKVSITQPCRSRTGAHTAGPGVRDAMVWQGRRDYKDARDPRNFFARFVSSRRDFSNRSEIRLPLQSAAFLRNARALCSKLAVASTEPGQVTLMRYLSGNARADDSRYSRRSEQRRTLYFTIILGARNT